MAGLSIDGCIHVASLGSVNAEERASLLSQKGVTIWFTGLSASGKVRQSAHRMHPHTPTRAKQSTIACALEQHLLHLHKFAYRLDGDNVRFGLNKDLGFDEKSRNENIRRIGEVHCSIFNWKPSHTQLFPPLPLDPLCGGWLQVAKLFSDACAITLTAFISPYRADRAVARELHEKSGIAFVEVFVDAPLSVVEQRDPKGLYKKARAGEIKGAS